MTRRLWVAVAILLGASSAQALTEEALLDSLQKTAFKYFWTEANPSNGLIKDRNTPGSPCSIASLGFGLSAICIGIDHGWVSRDAGRQRILTALQTLWTGPQGSGNTGTIGNRGLYYHFLDMTTALRTWDSELSTIDTALLFAGILDAKQYFSTADPADVQVRSLSDSIYQRADWEFMRNSGPGIRMGWKPVGGFSSFGTWIGYNEAMILYLLALGSPTHPVPTFTWSTWTSGYSWQTQYGQTYVVFPPLFGHQYSHCWVDFRNIQDSYTRTQQTTYWKNSRRATLAQRSYCIANPGHWQGYGSNVWGITASDTPTGYRARGAPPPQNDDGTITPTAPASSIVFAPEVVLPALHHLDETYGAQLWTPYGFRDAFNLTVNWWDTDVIGIDQGPIILMIENFRTGAVWNRLRQNADLQLGLSRAGFLPASTVDVGTPTDLVEAILSQCAPNPLRGATWIPFRLPTSGKVELALYDAAGRRQRTLVDGVRPAGAQNVRLDATGLPSGVYWYRLEFNGQRTTRRLTVVR
jgi:hypothetical protein